MSAAGIAWIVGAVTVAVGCWLAVSAVAWGATRGIRDECDTEPPRRTK